jgi:hypothetical protein
MSLSCCSLRPRQFGACIHHPGTLLPLAWKRCRRPSARQVLVAHASSDIHGRQTTLSLAAYVATDRIFFYDGRLCTGVTVAASLRSTYSSHLLLISDTFSSLTSSPEARADGMSRRIRFNPPVAHLSAKFGKHMIHWWRYLQDAFPDIAI